MYPYGKYELNNGMNGMLLSLHDLLYIRVFYQKFNLTYSPIIGGAGHKSWYSVNIHFVFMKNLIDQSKENFTISENTTSLRYALHLSYFTVAYNFLEGLLSILAGILAGSIALVGFGLDSFIESLSGSVMIWRFYESRNFSDQEHDRREKIAIKLVSYSFFVFGAYVLLESVKKLYLSDAPDPSMFGIIIALVSIIVMPILYHQKQKVGKTIASSSLLVDSKQTLACVFLSVALLIGLLLNYLFDIWWADPVVGLFLVIFLFKEGYNAHKEETLCC